MKRYVDLKNKFLGINDLIIVETIKLFEEIIKNDNRLSKKPVIM